MFVHIFGRLDDLSAVLDLKFPGGLLLVFDFLEEINDGLRKLLL